MGYGNIAECDSGWHNLEKLSINTTVGSKQIQSR